MPIFYFGFAVLDLVVLYLHLVFEGYIKVLRK